MLSVLFFYSLSLIHTIMGHRRRNDFQRGAKCWKSKMAIKTSALVPAVALAWCIGVSGGMCPLRSHFLENVVFNEAIWCTIFHHDKHYQHIYWDVYHLEQDGQKSGGAIPPLKSEGAIALLPHPTSPTHFMWTFTHLKIYLRTKNKTHKKHAFPVWFISYLPETNFLFFSLIHYWLYINDDNIDMTFAVIITSFNIKHWSVASFINPGN